MINVITTPNTSSISLITQGASLWVSDGADHLKPKGGKTVEAIHLELGGKVDVVAGKGLSTNDFTDTLKTKLNGIEESANNYTHPTAHDPSIITQDETNRFVSDTEKTTWNGKLATNGSANDLTFTDTNNHYTTDEVGEALVQAGAEIDAVESGKEDVANKKLTLTDNSDTFYPSQKAVKTVTDSALRDAKIRQSYNEQVRRTPDYAYRGLIGGKFNSSSHATNCYSQNAFNKDRNSDLRVASYWQASDSTFPQWIERNFMKPIEINRAKIYWEIGPNLPIICTHDVGPGLTGIHTDSTNFSLIIDWMDTNNYQPIFWSDALTFIRTGILPSGITKPCLIFFLGGGLGGVYTSAYPVLTAKSFKFNIAVSTGLIDTATYITSAQYLEMVASGLLEMHLYDPAPANVQISPDGTEDRDFAFREYYPATNSFETSTEYEARMYDRYVNAISILRDTYGQTQELITETPSWAYSKQVLRILERVGVKASWNLGSEFTLFGVEPFTIQDGYCAITESKGTVSARTTNITNATFSIPSKVYQYEIYVSRLNKPSTAVGWETGGDWEKVVTQRAGTGITIDPIYPKDASLDDNRADLYPVNAVRVKVISEAANNPAKIFKIELYYEGNQDVDVDNVRLENIENFNTVKSHTHTMIMSGRSLMPSGVTTANFTFPTTGQEGQELKILENPNIVVTPYKSNDVSPWSGVTYWIKAISTTGFTLNTSAALASPEYFYWIAMCNTINTVDV